MQTLPSGQGWVTAHGIGTLAATEIQAPPLPSSAAAHAHSGPQG